ncbi:MAG: lactate 2-monooxygenase [Saprospiraceae bacterium]
MNEQPFSASERQKKIYIDGISGTKSAVSFDYQDLSSKAQQILSNEAYAYISAGAGLEKTMKRNRNDFEKWSIVPRMLRDVSQRDISIQLLEKKYETPFLTCPIGVLELAHKEADTAVAKATSKLKIPMIFSNQASVPMEDCAAVMGDESRWFQLYWSKNNDLVKSLVQRAEKAGCEAIVVTLDTTMLGWRTKDLDAAYLPFLKGKGIAQYLSDPIFQAMLDEPEDENATQIKPKINWKTINHILQVRSKSNGDLKRMLKAIKTFINTYSRPSLQWKELQFLRECTDLPIFLKGILHPDDAKKAVEYGMDGIIVSNHGGRQVDGSVSTIEMLSPIVKSVNGAIPVLIDSGIRSGADVFKCLALGATAVCIGRPYVYGLAVAGELGVETILKNFIADFELTMGLAGCKNIGEINESCLKQNF